VKFSTACDALCQRLFDTTPGFVSEMPEGIFFSRFERLNWDFLLWITGEGLSGKRETGFHQITLDRSPLEPRDVHKANVVGSSKGVGEVIQLRLS
jgi:hypothetical protein